MTRAPGHDPRKAIPAPAGYVRFLLRKFATTSALREALLQGTDIDEERLQRPDAEVTLFTFVTMSANLSRVVGEQWPLDAAAAWSTAMQGALEVASRSAQTVAGSLEIFRRFGIVRGPFLSITLKRNRKRHVLVLARTVDIDASAWRSLSMATMLGLGAMLASVLELEFAKVEAGFPMPTPKYADRLRLAMGAQVTFDAKEMFLAVPDELCDLASPFADAGLFASAVAELEQLSRRMSSGNSLQLRLQEMLKRKMRGRLSEDDASHELGVSRRTLVRRLSASGTSFRVLLDAELQRRARIMLDEGKLGRSEMAAELGFDDPTSFSRACRRWFGSMG
ncbi:MAG: AraC family transcriptional regulator ligand-binding domain-containing protein [Micropepsaceae bacterium]